MESIARMMGHSSIFSTQIYAQITDQKILKGYGSIDDKYFVIILCKTIVIQYLCMGFIPFLSDKKQLKCLHL